MVGARNVSDDQDVFTCHRMSDGETVWSYEYPAIGRLDYGNSPRATPLIVGDRVVLQGAFGDLSCVHLRTGELIWQVNYQIEFGAEVPIWGFCGSPLLIHRDVDGQTRDLVVVQPGVEDASLVAFDLADGRVRWQTEGRTPSYSSLILAEVAETQQIIGYDATTLCGWDLDGTLLWEYQPEHDGDFNVPTPMKIGDRLFLTTENNGSRIFGFDSSHRLISKPQNVFARLAPDTHTPVVVGDLICGACSGLFCLNKNDLSLVHHSEDESFEEYASIVTNGTDKILVFTLYSEVLLAKVDGKELKILDRLQLSEEAEMMSHPALVGQSVILRFGRQLVRMDLSD